MDEKILNTILWFEIIKQQMIMLKNEEADQDEDEDSVNWRQRCKAQKVTKIFRKLIHSVNSVYRVQPN